MSNISIVIPGFDLEHLTRRCFQSIADHAGMSVEVVYIDNGSADGVADDLEQFGNELGLNLTVIRNETNLGFTVATNQGMRHANGNHVLLLNNDAHLTDGCLPTLLGWLEHKPRVAAVGPLSDDMSKQSIRHKKRAERRGEVAADPEDMIVGFCCLKHRDAIAEIGLLEESDGLRHGLGTDDEWCLRARRAGYEVLVCYDAFCHHDHHATFRHLKINRGQASANAVKYLRIQKGLK